MNKIVGGLDGIIWKAVIMIACMLIITIYTLYLDILTHEHFDEYIISGAAGIHYFHIFCVIFHVSYENPHTVSQRSWKYRHMTHTSVL